MKLPTPEPGLVICYSYLWHREHRQGRDEGRKDRPCVVIIVTQDEAGETKVAVAPITRSVPAAGDGAVALPLNVKAALGLDDQPAWVVVDELNAFKWPGYDLRPIRAKRRIDYGFLPPRFFAKVIAAVVEQRAQRRLRNVPRD